MSSHSAIPTVDELREGVSALGIPSVAVALPILFEEVSEVGAEPAPRNTDKLCGAVGVDALERAASILAQEPGALTAHDRRPM